MSSGPVVQVDVVEADGTTLVEELPFNIVADGQVQDMLTGDSLGELTIGLEASSDVKAALTFGRLLRWNGTGTQPFHSVIRESDQVSVAETKSQVPRTITVSGPGLEGQWEDARVQQWPGMEHEEVRYYTRHFNYASPPKVGHIDGSVYDHGRVLDYDVYGQPNQPDREPPKTWRDKDAKRLWTAPFSLDVPDGAALFRFTFATNDTNIYLRLHAVADDRVMPAWIGGVPVLRNQPAPDYVWGDTWATTVKLQPETTYDVVIRAQNEYTAPGGSAAWMGCAAWALISPDQPLETAQLKFRSQTAGWSGLDLPDPTPTPGWNPYEVCYVLCEEWQDSGHLTNWVVHDMSSTVGVEWEQQEEITFEVDKTTGLDVIRQFEGDGLAEFEALVVGGSKLLRAYPPGTRGDHATNPLPPTVSAAELMSLRHRWVPE